MDEKKSFGEYIRRKRLQAAFTQKELAQQLYVTESTISKWERGLSYPDVSLVTAICNALRISEHEFFTACDDDQAHAQARAAAAWRGARGAWRWFFWICYAIALTTCFLCDLILFHSLDWFWIVFASLALAYCFTNLPLDLKHNRLSICLAAASGCLLLLLLACWSFVGGHWLGGSVAIAAASLALPWGFWAIWWFYGRHVFPLCLAWFSAWVFGLLAVIRAFTGGAWLLGFAYPIAAFCLFYLWLLFALLYWLPCGPWLKGGLSTLLLAFAIPFGNWLFNWMVPTQNVPALSDYFAWDRLFTHENIHGSSWINVLVFVLMLICSAVLLCVGSVLEVRRRRKS